MKYISKIIDLMRNPLFNVSERKSIVFEKKYKDGKFSGNKMIKGKNLEFTTDINNNALGATLTLGKLEQEHNLKSKFEYSIVYNSELANHDSRLNNMSKAKPSFDNSKRIDKKVTKELFVCLDKWIKYCGIPNDFFEEEQYYLPIEDIISILDFCNEINKICNEYWYSNTKDTIELEYSIKYKCLKQNTVKLTSSFPTLVDAMIFYILSSDTKDGSYIKPCIQCNMLFVGRKNKLTCSQRCKDAHNHKYEKRKVRELEKKSQKGNNNDTDNQQK